MSISFPPTRKKPKLNKKNAMTKRVMTFFISQFHNQITSEVACEKMVFLVKNFEKLKQKEWSFCGFVQKIQNIVIFCPFWLVLVKNSNIHKDFVCFPFPCPLPAKMVSGFCKAKSKRKWTNRQMCGINSHLLFYFENLCKLCTIDTSFWV